MAPVKRFSSPLWTFSIPVLIGLLLSWGIERLPFLVNLEHKTFVYPERFAGDSAFAYTAGDPKHFIVEVAHFSPREISSSNIASHLIDQDSIDILGDSPLTAANWTFLTNSIHEAGGKHLIIAQTISWEKPDELALRALEHELTQLESYVVAINLERGAIPQKFPPYLQDSVIPSPEGAIDEIPEINQINPHPSIGAPVYGFAYLEQASRSKEEGLLKLPMLARWEDKLLPSLELASLIAAKKITPNEVIYQPGLFIQLGDLIIPIDLAGHTTVPLQEKLKSPSASEILESPEETSEWVSLASPESSPHLLQLPYTFDYLKSRRIDGTNWYGRLPFWKEAAFLVIFVLILHRRKWWLTFLAALAYIAFPFSNGEWLLFSPPLAAALAFTGLAIRGTGTKPDDPESSPSRTKITRDPDEEIEEVLPEPEEESPTIQLPKRHSSPKRQPKTSKERLAKKKRTH